MPQRTNAFQRLITLLTIALAGKANVTESAMLRDRVTGERREVDVLVESTTASYQVSLGIEVISWRRPADTPWVEKMWAKHENLPIDKLVLVSEGGFSKAARRKAEFYGIEVLSVEEAREADWPLITKLGGEGVFQVMTIHFDVAAVCRLDDGEIVQLPIPASSTFTTPTGKITIDQFVRGILDRQDVRDVFCANLVGEHEQEFWFSYEESQGLWRIEDAASSGQIAELLVRLKVMNRASPMKYAAGKFRAVPFLSGTSKRTSIPLEFVLTKGNDGAISGYLIDSNGIRILSNHKSLGSGE